MPESTLEPDLDYLRKVLLEMLAIPSPTGFTDTIVRYVAERLEELGIPYELTRRGTIRATLKGRQSSPDRAGNGNGRALVDGVIDWVSRSAAPEAATALPTIQ